MATVQEWGCTKCDFQYHSPIRLRVAPVHHCPPKSHKTAVAVFISGVSPKMTPEEAVKHALRTETFVKRSATVPEKVIGRVLKRRRPAVK